MLVGAVEEFANAKASQPVSRTAFNVACVFEVFLLDGLPSWVSPALDFANYCSSYCIVCLLPSTFEYSSCLKGVWASVGLPSPGFPWRVVICHCCVLYVPTFFLNVPLKKVVGSLIPW